MGAICRDPSPITNDSKRKEVKKMVLENNKIHRIIIQSETLVTVSNVESPSRIWVKLRNHITDQLQYRRGHKLQKLEGLPSVMDYVMAPLKVRSQTSDTDELVYARARVLKSNYELSVWLVHYIDEGAQQWLSHECLAKMEPAFFTHPWQAIPVCVFRARPDGEQWNDEHITILRDVLGQYELLRIQPILCKPQNNYAFYSRVLMYGVTNGSDPLKRGQCVLRQFYLRTMLRWPGTSESQNKNKNIHLGLSMYDATQQKVYEVKGESNEPKFERISEDYLGAWPEGFQEKDAYAAGIDGDDEYDPPIEDVLKGMTFEDEDEKKAKENRIRAERRERAERKWDEGYYDSASPPLSSVNVRDGQTISVCADWRSLISPDDFFAFLLDEAEDQLYDLFLKRDKWQIVLDDFYALPKNRYPIRPGLVQNALAMPGKRDPVYGILEVYDDQAEMGHFHRVEVISVRADGGSEGEFCKVRLIDCGGHKIVPIVSVLRIHSKHCSAPPRCLQLCMNMTERPAHWSDELCVVFKRVLRSDMPVYCHVFRMNPYSTHTPYKSPVRDWPGACLVENVRLAGAGDPSTIDDELQAALSDRGSQSHA